MKDLVSVNITTYNRADLLKRCITSVQRQSYKNIEIIVVDDASNDHTEKVVKELQKDDARIKYFKHPQNMGNACARNTALKNCVGKYIAFMDDDDEWIDEKKVEKQVQIFNEAKNKKLGIVCSGIVRKTSDRETVEPAIRPTDLQATVLRGGLIHNSTAMVPRDVMVEVGGFDESLPRGVDSEFFRRVIVKHHYDVHFMPDITCKYYEDSPNRMTSVSINGIKKNIESNVITLKKYKKEFNHYKKIKWLRKLKVIKMTLYVAIKEKNPLFLKKILEVASV